MTCYMYSSYRRIIPKMLDPWVKSFCFLTMSHHWHARKTFTLTVNHTLAYLALAEPYKHEISRAVHVCSYLIQKVLPLKKGLFIPGSS